MVTWVCKTYQGPSDGVIYLRRGSHFLSSYFGSRKVGLLFYSFLPKFLSLILITGREVYATLRTPSVKASKWQKD